MRSIAIQSAIALLLTLGAPTAQADYKAASLAFASKDWASVYRLCKEAADAGEMHCQANLGYLYKTGLGVSRDVAKSIGYLKRCADQGHSNCEEMLGDSYRQGVGVRVDYAEALRLFRSAASQGNLAALNNLGNLSLNGQGVARDPAEAAKHYRSAADKGHAGAQANLADLYRMGNGVEKNNELAFKYAQSSAKQNHGNGWNILGLLYRDGQGTAKDANAAIYAFKQALDPAVQNPAYIAYANLAGLYYTGNGVGLDLDESAKWAEAGVRVNQRNSMNILANILARGTKTLPKDPDRAFQLARHAHNLGLPAAKNTLGVFYRDGVGTPKDLQLALQMFTEGTDIGQIDSMVNLGRFHLDGTVVAKDPTKAHQYFLAAHAKKESAGPVARRFLEGYFAAQQPAPGKTAQTAGASTQAATVPSTPAIATAPDVTQQALLKRLEVMQRQLELLQSAATERQESTTDSASDSSGHLAVRRALVIGNDKYKHVPELRNAKEDAAAIAASLKKLGYSVTLHRDVDEKGFKKVLRDFRQTLEGGEEVLFFFAGHGVQLGAANYLLPVDIKGDNEEQVRDEAIELQKVLDDLKSKNSKFALAIIDACRDNPFKKSARAIGGRGLAPTTAATGQMIMFSAGAGQQALDALGPSDKDKNGIFTRVLLKEMNKPGIPVDRVLRNVRNEVVRLSKSIGHEQTPALYDQAVGDFYFKR